MSLSQTVKTSRFLAPSILRRPAETYPAAGTYDLFDVTGNILVMALTAVVGGVMAVGAKTIAVRANAVAMDNTAYDLASDAVGTRIIVHGAVAVETIVSALAASSRATLTLPWYVCPGIIDFILTTNPTVTGELIWELEWQPLTANATVVISP